MKNIFKKWRQNQKKMIRIGKKNYQIIASDSNGDGFGEEIDFGNDLWWQIEGYVGVYRVSDEDALEMQKNTGYLSISSSEKDNIVLMIRDDGKIRFELFGDVYFGEMADKRYYETDVVFNVRSKTEWRKFIIYLREANNHDVPVKIQLSSKGIAATCISSGQPQLMINLTKTAETDFNGIEFEDEDERIDETGLLEDETICHICKTKVKKTRFCSECGASLKK